MEQVELRGGGLLLRAPRPEDAEAVHAACTDPAIQRWTRVPVPYSEADAVAFVSRFGPEEWATGTGAPFAVLDERRGKVLGSTGLHGIDWANRRAAVGYWVARGARGRGVASGALELVAGWALGPLGLERLELYAETENTASRAVAERCGFTLEGVLRGRDLHRGARRDMALYGRLASDPPRADRAVPAQWLTRDQAQRGALLARWTNPAVRWRA